MNKVQIFGKSLSELRQILHFHEMTSARVFTELQDLRQMNRALNDENRKLRDEIADLTDALAERFKD